MKASMLFVLPQVEVLGSDGDGVYALFSKWVGLLFTSFFLHPSFLIVVFGEWVCVGGVN